jgi:hypothetical protein
VSNLGIHHVPVYRDHRVAHIHIPKTAGTSIERQFADLGDMHWNRSSWYGRIRRPDRWYEDHHLTLRELWSLSLGDIRGLDAFAVVRNPYQRLISEYRWRHQLVFKQQVPELTAFETFAEMVAAVPRDLAHNWGRYIAVADRDHANILIHLRPQWQYVCDPGGRPDPSVEIVRFERLRDDLEPLYRRWGVATRPFGGPRPPVDLAEYYTDESLAVVNTVYDRDFEWFGYERVETVAR